MTQPRAPEQFKLIETRRRDGYTYRLYKNALGETRQTYEIGSPLATDAEVQGFIRQLKKRAAGRRNMVPNAAGVKKVLITDPDRVDAILEDAANVDMTVRDVCAKHGISTKTYYRVLKGV